MSYERASVVTTSAMPAKHTPISITTGSTASGAKPCTMPSAYITSRIALPESSDLQPAHSHSPSTTSRTVIGACRMPSQVRCTASREYADHSASKVALFIVL